MKKLLFILLYFLILFNSCRECKDCSLSFETQYNVNELDSIVQKSNNHHSPPNVFVNYLDWNEFKSLNYPELNQEKRQCDPDLGEYIEDWEEEFWDEDTTGTWFYIGKFYYDCK